MHRSAGYIETRVTNMVARCRESGMNVTPQRIAIYKALLQSEEHPTPEILFEKVRREMPSLSLATIYKTLDALRDLGLVTSVPVTSDKRRFDANDLPHHHLVCSVCGTIRDYHTHAFDTLVPARAVEGFTPRAVSVNITGICAACKRKKRKEA